MLAINRQHVVWVNAIGGRVTLKFSTGEEMSFTGEPKAIEALLRALADEPLIFPIPDGLTFEIHATE